MSIRFGEFELDPRARTLSRDGQAHRISKKAFDLLEILVTNAPNAMTKQELYDHLWGETIVDEVNLPNLVSELRSTLGDSSRKQRFVRTLHSFGYAFAAPVDRGQPQSTRQADPAHVFSLYWQNAELPLRQGRNVLGRSDEADITLDSASISRLHACIVVDGLDASVEDLGSKNGTWVRGTRIVSITALRDGDEIRLGQVALVIRMIRRTASTASVSM